MRYFGSKEGVKANKGKQINAKANIDFSLYSHYDIHPY